MNSQIPAFGKARREVGRKGRVSDDECRRLVSESGSEVGEPSLSLSLREGIQIVPIDINTIIAVLLGIGCHCSCADSWIDVVSRRKVDISEHSKH